MMVTYAPRLTMKNGPHGLLQAAVFSAYMAVTFGVFVLGILAAIFLRSKYTPPSHDFHGSARFSTESEMEEFFLPARGLMPPGGFYLGPAEGGSIVLPRAITVKHGVIIGGPGTGKSRGYSLPNAAWSNKTSLVLFDPKYELFNYTSGFHHRVLRYAPTDPEASDAQRRLRAQYPAVEMCARG